MANGKTLSCRFYFVGRPLPVLRGKTGEYGRLSAGEKRYRVDCILSAARFQLCGAKLASMVGYRRAGKLCRTDFILSAARAQFLRDKTGECGRFVANEKTVPYRFSSVGRLLLVLQGTTGEKAVLWRTEKLYRVDFIFPAARSRFCKAKLASMVGL